MWKAGSGSASKWKAGSGSASKWKTGSGSASKWKAGSGSASTWCGSATLKNIQKTLFLSLGREAGGGRLAPDPGCRRQWCGGGPGSRGWAVGAPRCTSPAPASHHPASASASRNPVMDSLAVSERWEKPEVLGFNSIPALLCRYILREYRYLTTQYRWKCVNWDGGNGANVFYYFVLCRLYPSPPSHHGSNLAKPVISILLTTLYRECGLAYPYNG